MVDERQNRTSQPWLWLWVLARAVFVGVLALVLVLVVDPSLVIGSPPIGKPPTGLSVADKLKAQNDVRTTLVQVLAGLAVAGGALVAYRTYRQNRAEQDRTYQLNRAEQDRIRERELHARAEQDRTYERELYATAVEQLGHEKAPVRLGALYSLERLAQDKPERRQTIVDVICAYLRMPFSPTAPVIKPEPEAAEAPEVPAAETEGTGDTWRQERQVRLTAQRILSEHLRDDRPRDKRSTDPEGPRFWPGIHLNLVGATLIDFDLQGGVVADPDFRGATFTGDAVFRDAAFTGGAAFEGATFTDAWFGGAAFTGDAGFDETTFTGDAGFDGTAFTGDAWFGGATFTDAAFYGTTFTGGAAFDRATFTFHAAFDGTTFTGDASFGGAAFSRGESSVSFDGSRVVSPEAEHIWPSGWRLVPDGWDAYTVVRADDGLNTGLKPEEPKAIDVRG